MNALEAQGKAARKVRELRALSARLAGDVRAMHACDEQLRALQPHLSPAARAEIDRTLDRTNQQLADVFRHLLNPADEPA